MTVALEQFAEWRDSVEGRLYRLEAVGEQHAGKFKHHEAEVGAIDGDLSKLQVEFRAQRSMLQALHLTQNDHTARLRRLENGVQKLDAKVHNLEEGMHKVEAGIQTIIGLLTPANGHGESGGGSPN